MSVEHADVVKGLHKSLRQKVKLGVPSDQVWTDLLEDEQLLESYSQSMHMLAKNHWERGSSSCRITWCHKTCDNYFYGGGIWKVIKKKEKARKFCELRDQGKEETTEQQNEIDNYIKELHLDMFWKPCNENKLMLLDVGSCFNPFKEFEEFVVIAIDISPATDDVMLCDFLNLNFAKCNESNEFSNLLSSSSSVYELNQNAQNSLRHGVSVISFFDVVVFSLLLSYFPSPAQRFQCCINAHRTLKMYGLLLIITPDSSHQNRHSAMMKSWNTALQAIGFSKYKYEKLQHLHCIAFWKCSELPKDINYEELAKCMYIPQDIQECEEDDVMALNESSKSSCVYDVEEFSTMNLF